MQKFLIILLACLTGISLNAQPAKTDLYDFIKAFLYDSTGYENVGDWATGKPKKYPVKWETQHVEMSADTSINFFRLGTADLSFRKLSLQKNGQPIKWNIILTGSRMGYSKLSIIGTPADNITVPLHIDSLFSGKRYQARLIKACTSHPTVGYNYYELKLPRKDPAYIVITWAKASMGTAIRIDCYDGWSRQQFKEVCP